MHCTSCRIPLHPSDPACFPGNNALCPDCSRIEIIEDERSHTATVIMEMEELREAVAFFGAGKEAEGFEVERISTVSTVLTELNG